MVQESEFNVNLEVYFPNQLGEYIETSSILHTFQIKIKNIHYIQRLLNDYYLNDKLNQT